jgi:hypothetical protein
MNAEPAKSSHGLWPLALILLFVLPFLPEITIYVATLLAEIEGCKVDGRMVCLIGQVPASDIIGAALDAGMLVAASFVTGIAAVWLALCYLVVTRGWAHFVSRLLLAFVITVVFAFLPYLAPMLAITHLVNPNCRPNEGGVGGCIMFGGAVGDTVHDAVTAPWLIVAGAPIACGAFVIYVVVITFISTIATRRATGSHR